MFIIRERFTQEDKDAITKGSNLRVYNSPIPSQLAEDLDLILRKELESNFEYRINLQIDLGPIREGLRDVFRALTFNLGFDVLRAYKIGLYLEYISQSQISVSDLVNLYTFLAGDMPYENYVIPDYLKDENGEPILQIAEKITWAGDVLGVSLEKTLSPTTGFEDVIKIFFEDLETEVANYWQNPVAYEDPAIINYAVLQAISNMQRKSLVFIDKITLDPISQKDDEFTIFKEGTTTAARQLESLITSISFTHRVKRVVDGVTEVQLIDVIPLFNRNDLTQEEDRLKRIISQITGLPRSVQIQKFNKPDGVVMANIDDLDPAIEIFKRLAATTFRNRYIQVRSFRDSISQSLSIDSSGVRNIVVSPVIEATDPEFREYTDEEEPIIDKEKGSIDLFPDYVATDICFQPIWDILKRSEVDPTSMSDEEIVTYSTELGHESEKSTQRVITEDMWREFTINFGVYQYYILPMIKRANPYVTIDEIRRYAEKIFFKMRGFKNFYDSISEINRTDSFLTSFQKALARAVKGIGRESAFKNKDLYEFFELPMPDSLEA